MSMNFLFLKVNNMKYKRPHLPFGQHISVSTLVLLKKFKQRLSTIPRISAKRIIAFQLKILN